MATDRNKGDRFGLSPVITKELSELFSKFSYIDEVIIFGSRAKGCAHEGSDIDLAVKAPRLTYSQLMSLRAAIDDLELLYDIDIVDYFPNRGTLLGDHIDRVGLPFYRRK